MGTFDTHCRLTACEIVVGHQTRGYQTSIGCTCARLADKNHMESLLEIQILGASPDLKNLILILSHLSNCS